jgi:hypothetical protein
MRSRLFAIVVFVLVGSLMPVAATAETIDRISVVVGRQVIKASDIELDIRVTSFLNAVEPSLTAEARRQAASRLIDQALIRDQVRSGEFPRASLDDANRLIASIHEDRFHSDPQYRSALNHYGISEAELRDRLLWQLTVLRFIDAKFRPQVLLTDEEVQAYSNAHISALRKAHPEAKSLAELQAPARELMVGDKVNQLLNEWLEQSRKETRIEYSEKSLQ